MQENSHNFQSYYHSFWDRGYSCQISCRNLYVIIFLIYKRVLDTPIFIYLLLLYGVRSRSFGVMAEIESSYTLSALASIPLDDVFEKREVERYHVCGFASQTGFGYPQPPESVPFS